jgi:predicted Rossmann fold flavoprotein
MPGVKPDAPHTEAVDVAVVGAGPAGLMAAIAAAEAGRRVAVFEQLQRPGAKLLASGGGRCNLTNTLPREKFMARFGRQGRFMQPALAEFDSRALRRFLDGLGVPTDAPDGLHVYPASNSALAVQKALWRRACELGAEVRLGVHVTGLWLEGAAEKGTVPFSQRREKGTAPFSVLRGLETSGGRMAATHVILATGGRGYPPLGGSASGYGLAREAGHTIIEPTPALVPLVVKEPWVRRCAGASLEAARIWIDLPGESREGLAGAVLFTHAGLSGPAVLDLSGDVAALLARHKAVPLCVDLAPGITADEWRRRFEKWRTAEPRKTIVSLLDRHLPKSLAAMLAELAGIVPALRSGHMTVRSRDRLAQFLTALPLTVTATEGWDRAMVTRGGVNLKEVDPRTLRSKRLTGLALAGEVLDLDGPSGGFNLQWAFSSGYLAGKSKIRLGGQPVARERLYPTGD